VSDSPNKHQLRVFAGFVISAASISVVYGILSFGLFRNQEFALWTPRAELKAARSVPNKDIKLIVVDQKSLDVLAEVYQFQWPISRQFYIPIIEILNRGGAKGIAFDLIFSESSQLLVADDSDFASAVRDSKVPVVVPIVPYEKGPALGESDLAELSKRSQTWLSQIAGASDRFAGASDRFAGALMPIPQLLDSPAELATVREDPDADGIFRRYTMATNVKENLIPSLALSLAQKVIPGSELSDRLENLDSEGRGILNFRGKGGTYKSYSFIDLVSSWAAIEAFERGQSTERPIIDPAEFKDALVLVGVWAPGLQDLRPTPIDSKSRGVEVHATALDNILGDDLIKSLSTTITILISGAFIIFLSLSLLFIERIRIAAFVGIVLVAGFIAVGFQAALAGYWLEMFSPLVGMIMTIVGSFGYKYSLEGQERRFIKSAFKYYVSPSVIEKILADPSRLRLGGEKRELSIFFSDIEGFTSLSEKMEPGALSSLLNKYLTEMTGVILKHGGTVDKYVGDAIVAFWNAPIDVVDHADRAVAAAQECQKRLLELCPTWKGIYGVELRARIGINTGIVSVGNFGSEERFNYTVIGDAANLASRLEGANKRFGTSVMISEETYKKLSQTGGIRRLGRIKVVGKDELIQVYEVGSRLSEDEISQFMEGIDAFERGDIPGAAEKLRDLSADPVARLYLERILKQDRSTFWSLTEK